jgi:hypothetical protein
MADMSTVNCSLQRRILEHLEQFPDRKMPGEELDKVLVEAEGIPASAEWLSKNVRTIAATTVGMTVDTGWRGKERILKLGQVNTVGTVGGSGECTDSINGTAGTDGIYEDGDR